MIYSEQNNIIVHFGNGTIISMVSTQKTDKTEGHSLRMQTTKQVPIGDMPIDEWDYNKNTVALFFTNIESLEIFQGAIDIIRSRFSEQDTLHGKTTDTEVKNV